MEGFGTAVTELVNKEMQEPISIKVFGYPENFIEHGKVEELEIKYELDAKNIARNV